MLAFITISDGAGRNCSGPAHARRWVGVRMDLIALALLVAATLFSMAFRRIVSPALLALALTQLLQLSGSMQWAVRQTAEAENHMTSVERMVAYTALPQERPADTPTAPAGWPASAALEFEGVEVCLVPCDAACTDRTCSHCRVARPPCAHAWCVTSPWCYKSRGNLS